jgi:hypothetical protein
MTTAQSEPAASRPSIARHPAFPAVVALWFAALLGLGTMVVPVTLLEALVGATGLSAVVPGAQAPLGFTARGLIALCAAGAGAVGGLVLARKLSRLPQIRPMRIGGRAATGQDDQVAMRGPIRAHEELGSDGLPPAGLRRRTLTLIPDRGPSDFAAPAPVPGDTVRDSAAAEQAAAEFAAAPAAEFLDLGAMPEVLLEEPAPADVPPVQWRRDPDPVDTTRYARPALGEHSLQSTAAVAPPVADLTQDGPDLHELSLMNLAQRLALSLQQRRAMQATRPVPMPAAEPAPAAMREPPAQPAAALAEPAHPEEAAQAMAVYFSRPAAPVESPVADDLSSRLSALRTGEPDPGDEYDDRDGLENQPATFRVNLAAILNDEPIGPDGLDRFSDNPSLADLDDESLGESENVDDPAFAPLQVRNSPGAARPFDRPGGAPAAQSVHTPAVDDALRNALAKLQRLSGAA